ncbi:MAG TPA: 3-deoxy-7-phosphoheptulonate synthase [Polyangiaceae bacterium]|nr:3-deoxy-7-phosphoheptulonate synthase [Polyangiaceae bacterium]
MRETKNLRVVDTAVLQSPNQVLLELPLGDRAAEVVFRARAELEAVLNGGDRRRIVIVGPCSIHDPEAALDYAVRLLKLRERVADSLLVVMRVYFEKPRTTVGWKGLINDPHLDGTFDIPTGIRVARRLLRELAEMGLPSATEMLDPIIPQYIADVVAWSAIGARTTESQTHREMASGLSMPVGFKNGTDGSLGVAINAMIAASRPHSFLGIDGEGRVGVVRTSGNPHAHLVLRGGSRGPNFARAEVERAALALAKQGVNPGVLVDCSHDNSGKDPERQPEVLAEVGAQIRDGSAHLLGAMIESNIVAGRQDLRGSKRDLVYGQSITDGCVDFATTERILEGLARDAGSGRPVVVNA